MVELAVGQLVARDAAEALREEPCFVEVEAVAAPGAYVDKGLQTACAHLRQQGRIALQFLRETVDVRAAHGMTTYARERPVSSRGIKRYRRPARGMLGRWQGEL
jgi:hypothetical protein